MPRKKRSNRQRTSSIYDIDGGATSVGFNDPISGHNAPPGFYGTTRPDTPRGVGTGVYNDPPDPIRRPQDKIRIVQLPGTIIYVPVRPKKKPPKKKGGGGSSPQGVE